MPRLTIEPHGRIAGVIAEAVACGLDEGIALKRRRRPSGGVEIARRHDLPVFIEIVRLRHDAVACRHRLPVAAQSREPDHAPPRVIVVAQTVDALMVLLRQLLGDALRHARLRQERTLREVSASAREQ